MRSPQSPLRVLACVAMLFCFLITVPHLQAASAPYTLFIPIVMDAAPEVSTPTQSPEQSLLDSEETAALTAANALRTSNGCAALKVSKALVTAATEHSEDMAANSFFDHQGSDGSEPWDRATAAGYSWTRIGENIAMGVADGQSVNTLWENSPPHRANILNCAYQDIGIARAKDADGTWYWTEIFGAQ